MTDEPKRKERGNGEGSVFKRVTPTKDPDAPTVRWVAQVVVDGQQRRTFHKTEAQAKKALREAAVAVDNGVNPGDGSRTLGHAIERWQERKLPALMKGKEPPAPRTVESYTWACVRLSKELGTLKLKRLTPEQIEAGFEKLADAGMARASIVKLRSQLKMVLAYENRNRTNAFNVATVVDIPPNAREQRDGRTMSETQVRDFLAVAKDDRLSALWVTMAWLGVRLGEASGLTWADIDFTNSAIHIRRALKIEGGKLVHSETLKTKTSKRSIRATPELMDVLRAHKKTQAAEKLKAGELWQGQPAGLVFTSSAGTALDPNNLRRTFAKLTTAAGLGKWHPHELRHTASSHMSDQGTPPEKVADVLGQKDTRMFSKVYRKPVNDVHEGALIMSKVLGSGE